MTIHQSAVALILLTILFGSGCLGYRLGPVAPIEYESVAVPMFANKTVTPQLEAQVTNGIIKRLQEDGALRIVSSQQADVVVHGTILRYRRDVLRTEKDDSSVPREYRVSLVARVSIHDQRKGTAVVTSRELEGQADTFIGTDLQAADYQALPLAADDLAKKVVALLTERW